LITAETHEVGVSTISEGKEAVLGVCRGGRTGRVNAGMANVDNERVEPPRPVEVDAE
jgi:hypothetical protein